MKGNEDIRTHHSQHPKGGDSPSLQEKIKNKLETTSSSLPTIPNGAHGLSFFSILLSKWVHSPSARPPPPLLKKITALAKLAEVQEKSRTLLTTPSISLGLRQVTAPLPASYGWQVWFQACCHL